MSKFKLEEVHLRNIAVSWKRCSQHSALQFWWPRTSIWQFWAAVSISLLPLLVILASPWSSSSAEVPSLLQHIFVQGPVLALCQGLLEPPTKKVPVQNLNSTVLFLLSSCSTTGFEWEVDRILCFSVVWCEVQVQPSCLEQAVDELHAPFAVSANTAYPRLLTPLGLLTVAPKFKGRDCFTV